MEVQEIKERKRVLCNQIKMLLESFKKDTGVLLIDIEVTWLGETVGNSTALFPYVEAKVEL